MFKNTFQTPLPLAKVQNPLLLVGIVAGNMAFNILANVCFKYSTTSANVPQFVAWQVVGNLAGFITVITLTWLLKYIPLHVAFPLTTGLAVIGVYVIGRMLFFKEPISNTQWLGTLVIIVGIVLISG
jgi:multidrug transporter EmrE-like cation transporter